MAYQIALGWNSVILTDIPIQPRTTGLKPGRRRLAGNQATYEDGTQSTALEYGYLTPTQFDTLYNLFDLVDNASAQVTITLPDNTDRDFVTYNATIQRPEPMPRFERGKWLNVAFPLIGIQEM